MNAELQQCGFRSVLAFVMCKSSPVMFSENLLAISYGFLQQESKGHNDKVLLPLYDTHERPFEVATWEKGRKKKVH